MGYVDCPNCAKRLRVPDVPGAAKLRCPSCGHSFERPDNDVAPNNNGGESTNVLADEMDESLDDSYLSSAETVVGNALGVSDEDLASLDRFGAGSGLMDLTRDSGETSLGAAFRMAPTAEAEAPAETGKASSAVAAAREQARQQIQIVKTALDMARKLESNRETELYRSRRFAMVGWATVVVLLIAALGLLWWGGGQAGQYKAERATSASLSDSLTRSDQNLREEKARQAALGENLQSAQQEIRGLQQRKDDLQTQLMTARESLAGREAELRVLGDELAKARAQTEAGVSEINALQSQIKTLQAEIFLLRDKVVRNGQPATRPSVAPAATPPMSP